MKKNWIKLLYLFLFLAKKLKIINWSWFLILMAPLFPILFIAVLSIVFLGTSHFLKIIVENME